MKITRRFLFGLLLFGFSDFMMARNHCREFKKVATILNGAKRTYLGGYSLINKNFSSLPPSEKSLQDSSNDLWKNFLAAKTTPCEFSKSVCGPGDSSCSCLQDYMISLSTKRERIENYERTMHVIRSNV